MHGSVLQFPRQPLGQYLRVGRAHRELEYLFESKRLPVRRAVFEASLVARQIDFIRELGKKGVELVLDTNVAELSVEGRYRGGVHNAPWALEGRPLGFHDFKGPALRDLTHKIAAFAVDHGFDAIVSPSHLLSSASDPWLAIDFDTVVALREALDREGGKSVSIDFELTMPYSLLRDKDLRAKLNNHLTSSPFENLWFRTSGIGRESTGLAFKRYIDAIREFTSPNGSVIVDHLAGLGALAMLAFGAAGGISHGVGDRERFDASGWNTPPQGGGGASRRVLVSALDRQITMSDLTQIEKSSGGRRLIACTEIACCPRGIKDMYENERAHYAFQRHKQLTDLSRISAPGRADYFVSKLLRSAELSSRAAARLKLDSDSLAASLKRDSDRIERMSVLFESEAVDSGKLQRVREPRFRKASTLMQKGWN